MKALNKAIVIVVASLAVLAGLLPASVATAQPHEDPDAAPWVFDGTSLLQKYSLALDLVPERDFAGLDTLHEQASLANIPVDLKDSVDTFLFSGRSLSELIPAIRADLEASRTLLSQSRPEEAASASRAALSRLIQAYTQLRAMDTATADAGRWWKVASAHPQGPLHRAYDEVTEKLLRLRNMLGLLDEMGRSVTQQADILSAIAKGASGADLADALRDTAQGKGASGADMADALKDTAQGGLPPDILAQLINALSKGAVLSPTTLTLAVSTQSAFVGEEVQFLGALAAGGKPLPGRKVTILLDGSVERVMQTDSGGFFNGRIALPYRYAPAATLQAIYYPEGVDLGFYLGCSSPEVGIEVRFYAAAMSIDVADRGYPGLDLVVKGKLDYGDSPMSTARTVAVYWDDELVDEQTIAGQFEAAIAVASDIPLGRHQVTAYAPAQGRYAPVSAGAQVQVARVPGSVYVRSQQLLLLPMSLDVSGRAQSPMGPLKGALLTIRLGDWEATTRSDEEGKFNARLDTGLSLTLFGAQQLSVQASPEEPWHETISATMNMTVINPVNIAGLVLAVFALALYGVRWMRRRPMYAVAPAAHSAPAAMNRESPQRRAPAPQEIAVGPRAVLLAVYKDVLRLVQNVTAVALGPSRTLREFAQECAPRLGPLAGPFRELTLMVERLLYSRHDAEESQAARGADLGRTLKEGLKREGS